MIKAFFKEYRLWYYQYALVMGFYLLIFWLYHLPIKRFAVASVLAVSLLFLFSLWKYYQFHRKINMLQKFIYVNELDSLTSPSEQAYQALIMSLQQAQANELVVQENRQKKLEGIVKMWVHQMKIPLSAISLMTQIDTSIDTKEYRLQVNRIEDYLNNLLNYLKFRQSKDDFRFQECSMKEIVLPIIKKYSHVCIAKGISISVKGDWQFSSDKKWLAFALTQLIDNAVKYSKKDGHIEIIISRKSIIISDNGIGILKEDLPRIFEEGFTGFNGHEHQKATGLGLSITKEILENLHLSIQIDSLVGLGTTVRLSPLGD
ncbi:sensor histidine kinase [Streptococcus phocae subsp. phocae]